MYKRQCLHRYEKAYQKEIKVMAPETPVSEFGVVPDWEEGDGEDIFAIENEPETPRQKEMCIRDRIEEMEYDTKEHDWITEQEMGSSIMKETENLWTPVKRFLNKHKKPKWGDWDGLHIEEEEL